MTTEQHFCRLRHRNQTLGKPLVSEAQRVTRISTTNSSDIIKSKAPPHELINRNKGVKSAENWKRFGISHMMCCKHDARGRDDACLWLRDTFGMTADRSCQERLSLITGADTVPKTERLILKCVYVSLSPATINLPTLSVTRVIGLIRV